MDFKKKRTGEGLSVMRTVAPLETDRLIAASCCVGLRINIMITPPHSSTNRASGAVNGTSRRYRARNCARNRLAELRASGELYTRVRLLKATGGECALLRIEFRGRTLASAAAWSAWASLSLGDAIAAPPWKPAKLTHGKYLPSSLDET